jgi:hypothetical protein
MGIELDRLTFRPEGVLDWRRFDEDDFFFELLGGSLKLTARGSKMGLGD